MCPTHLVSILLQEEIKSDKKYNEENNISVTYFIFSSKIHTAGFLQISYHCLEIAERIEKCKQAKSNSGIFSYWLCKPITLKIQEYWYVNE